jgi:cbb3-type cytochrome oxidase maturation protein
MSGLLLLIPIALIMGLGALAIFLWALKSGQYEDLDGAAERIFDEEFDRAPARPKLEPRRPV